MYYFCTYFDRNYLSRGLVLLESLIKHVTPFKLFVLSLDDFTHQLILREFSHIVESIPLTELEGFDAELFATKTNRKSVEYYFTLTPCLPRYILSKYPAIDIITYIDADIYFFSSPRSAFDELGDNSVIIVPHHFSEKNKYSEKWGKYNVVFNTFKNDIEGLKVLNWWREKCLEWCYDYLDEDNDRFGDQKYLESFPRISKNVTISNLKGLNVAAFNVDRYIISNKDEVYFVDEEPIIFYHYQFLKQIHPFAFELYDPAKWDKEVYDNNALISLYVFYIKRLSHYEKRYNLHSSTIRDSQKLLSNRQLLYQKMISGYPIITSPFYTGIVHLEKIYRIYKKIFKKDNKQKIVSFPSQPQNIPLDTMLAGMKRINQRGVIPLTIFDVGAAAGSWTLQALSIWPKANYILFEPLVERKSQLETLVSNNSNLTLVPSVVGREEGEVNFFVTDDLDGSGIADNGTNATSRKVLCTTIDNQVKKFKAQGPFLIKLDTHGYEVPIIDGAEHTLKDTCLIIIECYGFQIAPQSLLFWEMCQLMDQKGFRLIDIVDTMRREKDQAFWQCDVFFIPKNSPVFSSNTYN